MSTQDAAIKVKNIAKCYRIGLKEIVHDSIGSAILDFIKSPLKNYRKYRSLYRFDDINTNSDSLSKANASDTIWALKDVSFEVKQGEVVGIIGRNGAGKSTLLKILCKITNPTKGCAELRGRVSSLLEVGTGFHPELTGRENVYLNGTILGMRKKEVDRKFDEIVAFSGVEKFIDTPVKRYSSGMRVRLAFSVAAYLEPEILVIDEVLAVGDANFQKKSLNKMHEIGQHGRTVLFVSHNMAAITRLCERTILLEEGAILKDGPTQEVVSTYLNTTVGAKAERKWTDTANAPGNDIVRLHAVRVKTEKGLVTSTVDIRQPVGIEIEYEVLETGFELIPNFTLHNEDGVCILTTFDRDPEWKGRVRPAGRYVSTGWIPGNFLAEGRLIVGLAIKEPSKFYFYEREAVAFQVIDSLDDNSVRGNYLGKFPGVVRPLLKWSTQFSPNGNKK